MGSANLDSRSLRLNFELMVEIYDERCGQELARHFLRAREISRPVTLSEVEGRALPVRFRDALAWLFSAYL